MWLHDSRAALAALLAAAALGACCRGSWSSALPRDVPTVPSTFRPVRGEEASSFSLEKMESNMGEEQWRKVMRPFDGKKVAAFGCAARRMASSDTSSILLRPCCYHTELEGLILDDQELPRTLVVNLRSPMHEMETLPVRVVGILRLRPVTDERGTWSWGSIEDATWELAKPGH